MQHATLYKRTKTGAIQYWSIATWPFDKHNDSPVEIRKESGQLGTLSPVVHKENITSGKNIGRSNETTPLQQAEAQALADWAKKHDEGYKSLQDLDGISGSTYAGTVPLNKYLDSLLPQFNTDASGNVKPMLAKAVNWDKVIYPCYVQPKLDGVRCLMVVDYNNSNYDTVPIQMLSRNGKPYTTLNHIKESVAHYCFKKGKMPTQFILDGEIYSDEISFQEIIAAVKKQRPDSLKLKFRAYDIVSKSSQVERIQATVNIVNNLASHYVQFVDTKRVGNKDAVLYWHDKWVADGNEGAMIRLLDGKYCQGQRSSSLMKVKEFNSEEFKFQAFEKGQRDEDLIAVCLTVDSKMFRAKMVGTAAHKAKLVTDYVHNEFDDSFLTVKFFGLTTDGIPRFPVGINFRNYE